MTGLLCVAILIIICFLVGGIAGASGHRAERDSVRGPLTVMVAMMILALVGMAWAARLPHREPQTATQVMTMPSDCCTTPVQVQVEQNFTPLQQSVEVHTYN